MKKDSGKTVRCAIYTRVSSDSGLEQDFNSLDAQHEASQAYIKSQAHAGWTLIRTRYDDGGYSGGSTERPALQRLLEDLRARKVDIIVVYKVDRLTRSLADFAKLVELFDAHGAFDRPKIWLDDPAPLVQRANPGRWKFLDVEQRSRDRELNGTCSRLHG